MGKYCKILSKSASLNYTLKLSKSIETLKNSQILSLNVACFRDKLHLLPNLFFQNTKSFTFSIQPEAHAIIDGLFLLLTMQLIPLNSQNFHH